MKKILLTLLLCLTLGAASAWAEEKEAFELSFITTEYTEGTQGYTTTWTHTHNGYTWKLVNFHNNNKGWGFVRAIAKSKTETVTIDTQTKASQAVSSIVINMQKQQGSNFNSLSLIIADDANFTTNVTTLSQTVPTSDWSISKTPFNYLINISDPQPDKFYRISFNIQNTTKSSGALQVNSIQYLYDDTPAGPVEPGDVLVNGQAASTEPIEAVDGETITFTSDKAAKLEYLSEELDLLDEVTGSTYTHAADFSKGNTYQITVTPYDSDNKEYAEKAVTVTISKKLVTPEAVLVNGAAATQEAYELAQGEEITFTSANATKLEYESEELELIDEITGSSFTHTAQFTDELKEYTLTVTPVDNFGNIHEDLAATVKIKKIAAPLCGAITFTPADGAVYAGNAVTIACENAETIKYTIDGGEELTYDAATGIVIPAACKIVAWGVNGDGVESEKAELNVTIKEAERYVQITSMSELKLGDKYLFVGVADKQYYLPVAFTGDKGKFDISATTPDGKFITVAPESNIFTCSILAADTEGKYLLYNENTQKYLGFPTSGTDINYTTKSASTIEFQKDGTCCISSNGSTRALILSTDNNANKFGNYAKSNTSKTTYSYVLLYRLVTDEYCEAPAELHIHGSHFSGSWAASSQFDQTAPGEFTFYGFLAYEEGDATPALVFSSVALPTAGDTEVVGIRPRKAAPEANYWNDLEGDVFMPETDGATVGTHRLVRVSTADLAAGKALNTFAAEHNKSYDLTVDFNGYSPVATLAAHDENNVPTGVENIDAAETAEVEYYNLSGLRVANPENGIFIRRQGNKVTKVLVK